jgi:hypothetical protein
LDYTYTADGSERLANLTFEGPSLRLELNYAGNYNRSTRDSQQSICINGHLAPSFFLLGAQKSATTNFAARFAQAALSVVPPKPREADPGHFGKELHVFDHKERFEQLGLDGFLSYYPRCGTRNYAVGMDATPAYLPSERAPGLMRKWYSTLSERLVFLVLLRHPVYRMRSGFYQSRKHGGCLHNPNLCKSFTYYISHALANTRQGCPSGRQYPDQARLKACENPDGAWLGEPCDPFYLSLYALQLEIWLSHFAPSQFVIAPFLTYVAPEFSMPDLVKFIAQRVGSSIKATSPTTAIPKGTPRAGSSHEYPPLETDLHSLGDATQHEFGKIIAGKAGPAVLARLRSPRMARGLTLFGYDGAVDDVERLMEHP